MEFKELKNAKDEEFKKVFREYFACVGINLKSDTLIFDEIQKDIDENGVKILTIRKADKLIAFIIYQEIKMKGLDGFFKQKLGFIREFYVMLSERGNGYSKLLSQRVEDEFKKHNIKKVILNAHEDMYDFYFKQGYYIDDTFTCANELKCLFKEL